MTQSGPAPGPHIFRRKVTPGPSPPRDTPPSAALRGGLGTGPWAWACERAAPDASPRGHAGSGGSGAGSGRRCTPSLRPLRALAPGNRPSRGGGHSPEAAPTAPARGSPRPLAATRERGGRAGLGAPAPSGLRGRLPALRLCLPGAPRLQAPELPSSSVDRDDVGGAPRKRGGEAAARARVSVPGAIVSAWRGGRTAFLLQRSLRGPTRWCRPRFADGETGPRGSPEVNGPGEGARPPAGSPHGVSNIPTRASLRCRLRVPSAPGSRGWYSDGHASASHGSDFFFFLRRLF